MHLAKLVRVLNGLPKDQAEQLLDRQFRENAYQYRGNVPIGLLRLAAMRASPAVAYVAARVLVLRTDMASDWLSLGMSATSAGRYDVAEEVLRTAIARAEATGEDDVAESARRCLESVALISSASWSPCSLCGRRTSPTFAIPHESDRVCSSCAAQLAELALQGGQENIWNVSSHPVWSDEYLPLFGREDAAAALAEMGDLANAVRVAAHAIEIDDAATTAGALAVLLSPPLVRAGAWHTLRQHQAGVARSTPAK